MATNLALFRTLSDHALLARVNELAAGERSATADLIASLAELDARRLYLGAGCSSLFAYCTSVLHLSEHAAYGRIEAARLARRYPRIVELLTEGAVTLTTVCLLSSILTDENQSELLAEARFKTKRQVEELVARMRPQPAVATSVRKLPSNPQSFAAPPASPTAPRPMEAICASVTPRPTSDRVEHRASVAPLAPDRYKVQFTLTADGHAKLRRAQDLLRHACPNGDPAAIFERALTLLVDDLERRKLAATSRPARVRVSRAGTRHIPASVRREVWKRDGARCAFVGTQGRCSERGFLEFHHVVPFADDGQATVGNIQLRCAAHNRYEAERWFGGGDAARESSPPYGSGPPVIGGALVY